MNEYGCVIDNVRFGNCIIMLILISNVIDTELILTGPRTSANEDVGKRGYLKSQELR